MKKLSLLTVCLFTFFFSQAQSNSTHREGKQKSFITSLRTLDSKTIKGTLSAVNDSQLVVANAVTYSSNQNHVSAWQYIPAENIRSFSIKRKNSVLKGTLIGAGAGAVAGMAIGWMSGDDPVQPIPANAGFEAIFIALGNSFALTSGQKATSGGLALGVGGAIAGTIMGVLAKKKFIIGGNKAKFRKLKPELSIKLG